MPVGEEDECRSPKLLRPAHRVTLQPRVRSGAWAAGRQRAAPVLACTRPAGEPLKLEGVPGFRLPGAEAPPATHAQLLASGQGSVPLGRWWVCAETPSPVPPSTTLPPGSGERAVRRTPEQTRRPEVAVLPMMTCPCAGRSQLPPAGPPDAAGKTAGPQAGWLLGEGGDCGRTRTEPQTRGHVRGQLTGWVTVCRFWGALKHP